MGSKAGIHPWETNMTLFYIDKVAGYIDVQIRYVKTGPEEIECQTRTVSPGKEPTEWEPISKAYGVPAEWMLAMLA